MRPDPDELGPDGDDLGRVVEILSATTEDDARRDAPPPGLWESIAAQLPSAEATDLAEVTDAPDAPAEAGGADVIDLSDRRRRMWVRVASAAAVVLLVAGTYGVVVANRPDTTQELVASVQLEPLKAAGSGSAELVTVDGVEQLRVTAQGLPPAPDGHHYEMWLIDRGVTDPQSLGKLPAGQDEVVVDVPAGVDPDDFPIVDINVQVDGQAEHSGVDTSVLRGTLA